MAEMPGDAPSGGTKTKGKNESRYSPWQLAAKSWHTTWYGGGGGKKKLRSPGAKNGGSLIRIFAEAMTQDRN